MYYLCFSIWSIRENFTAKMQKQNLQCKRYWTRILLITRKLYISGSCGGCVDFNIYPFLVVKNSYCYLCFILYSMPEAIYKQNSDGHGKVPATEKQILFMIGTMFAILGPDYNWFYGALQFGFKYYPYWAIEVSPKKNTDLHVSIQSKSRIR